jgi:hypothetical protein
MIALMEGGFKGSKVQGFKGNDGPLDP